MANDESTDLVPTDTHGSTRDPGSAVERSDALRNPGLPPHRQRVTDLDPKEARHAERIVVVLFYISIIGSIFAMTAYFAFPIKPDDLGSVRLNNVFIGIGISFALLAIGIAAVHWAKVLMVDQEGIDVRHPVNGTPAVQARAA